MSHSYSICLMHYVFSTKNREPTITPELQSRLWPYLGGLARERNAGPLAIGGIDNHVHILVDLPATITIAKAAQEFKALSSKWIHETFPRHRAFAWQEGYGAFSVSVSNLERIIQYIENQAQHHGRLTFEDEFVALLKKHNLTYDARYVFG
jgi:putative transposase